MQSINGITSKNQQNNKFRMKKLHQSFDVDSRSTQEKDKKFCRKGISPSPKSNSSRSDNSLSKFWVKNLKTCASGKELHRPITASNCTVEQGIPGRSKSRSGNGLPCASPNQPYEGVIDRQQKQIQRLSSQILQYEASLEKQNQKQVELETRNEQCQKQNAQLRQTLAEKECIIKQQAQQILKLNSEISQKDTLLNAVEKQPSSLKNIKSAIFQAKLYEHEKERQRLTTTIAQMQVQLRQYSHSSADPSPLGHSCVCGCHQSDAALRQELYEAKEQLNKASIASACLQRKHHKEMELLRQRKQKEYEEVRKKFTQLLEKYRVSMKRNASEQIKHYKQKQQHGRRTSIDSVESLAFSSDSEQRQ